MSHILNFFKNLLLTSSILIIFGTICFAQEKADLEVTTQTASETARGGETFTYTVTVKNIGSVKATDVVLLHESRQGNVSAVPSSGSCELDVSQVITKCRLGDFEPNSGTTIFFSIRIMDFDEPDESLNRDVLRKFPTPLPIVESGTSINDGRQETSKSEIATIYVFPAEEDLNSENNRNVVQAELLPSLNKAPQVEILSPKGETIITRRTNKLLEVALTIKAFDPDGTIERVVVDDPEYSWKYVEEDGQYKYSYDGRTFTAKEFEEYLKTTPLKERLATKTGKDTFTYILRNPNFRENVINVVAYDNVGRSRFTQARFTVEGDAQIEIVSPKDAQVFTPNSTIKIETASKINDPLLSNLRIMGTQQEGLYWSDFPALRQVSKMGNVYKHQYLMKNVPEGTYRITAVLINDSIPTNYSNGITLIVAKPRIIKIASLKNGQEFEQFNPIKLRVEATDINGKMVHDRLELLIDGKIRGEVFNSWTNDPVDPNKQINDLTREYNLLNLLNTGILEKGIHTIQVIAKENNFSSGNKAILGQSEIVTIRVK